MSNKDKEHTKFDKSSLEDLESSFQQYFFEQNLAQDKTFYDPITSQNLFPDILQITSTVESNKGALKQSKNMAKIRHGNAEETHNCRSRELESQAF